MRSPGSGTRYTSETSGHGSRRTTMGRSSPSTWTPENGPSETTFWVPRGDCERNVRRRPMYGPCEWSGPPGGVQVRGRIPSERPVIVGAVSTAYEPVVRLKVQGPSGHSQEIRAIVDTGYNGYLTLPPELASALELPFVTTNPAYLADGSEVTFEVYGVTVPWDGRPREVDAHMSDTMPLVGMRYSHSVYVDVEKGGRVVIQAWGSQDE